MAKFVINLEERVTKGLERIEKALKKKLEILRVKLPKKAISSF